MTIATGLVIHIHIDYLPDGIGTETASFSLPQMEQRIQFLAIVSSFVS
jgi:hypothetical protein